jgi:hypothetical protein
MVNQGHMT